MGVDRHGLSGFQGLGRSARVVVVAVAEDQSIDFAQGNPQLVGVACQHATLPGVEQDVSTIGFDPVR